MAIHGCITMEEWTKIINHMIRGFKLYIIQDKRTKRNSKTYNKKIRKGFELFTKWFSALWY